MSNEIDLAHAELARAVAARVRTNQVEARQQAALPPDPVAAERGVWSRFTPRKNHWGRLAEFDARVAELDQRRAAISERIGELEQRRANAPRLYAEALASWLDGEKGPRPQPELPAIEAELITLRAEHDALLVAADRVLQEKVAFAERNRRRLVREADRHVTEIHARYLELLAQAEQTRQELADCRQAAIYAALYPDQAAGQEPNTALLTGGLRRPVERTLGVATQLAAERVFQALRLDGVSRAPPPPRSTRSSRAPTRPRAWRNGATRQRAWRPTGKTSSASSPSTSRLGAASPHELR